MLFCIGTPDGSSGEFGCAAERWPAFLKVFPGPVEYIVGKSKPTDWPYLHPADNDKWAGGHPLTFTIRFTLGEAAARPLFFMIGVADAHPTEPSRIAVTVNGQALPERLAPKGRGVLAFEPEAFGDKPETLVFPLPAGAARQGENAITITLRGGSWILYDYVALSTDAAPPKIVVESPALLAEALQGPLAGVEDVVFAARPVLGEHWYANFGYYAAESDKLYAGGHQLFRDGAKLCRLNLRSGQVMTLLDDAKGGLRDPQVHYDGKKVLFSYRKGDTYFYNLYEIDIDGTNLRRLTDAPYDDIEPTYMPDGSIVFVSSRCQRWVNCWLTQVATLHRCDADGRNVRMISSNNEHDNTPWPLLDGTVLYTRWEYVDRSQVDYHHLWIVNPDGTDQRVYFGNLNPGTVMIDAKPIPGTRKIVSIFSPGHGQTEHAGAVAIVDPSAGPDERSQAHLIGRGQEFRDPYALSADCFLVARNADLVLMNGRGLTQTVYTLPEADRKAGLWLHEPRPIMPRPREPVLAAKTNPSEATGRMVLVDVATGRRMAGVKPGEVKKLLVLESLPKPINFTGGMEPLSYGGTFTLERVLGTVPVEADGSAHFEVPALRSLIFVAIDGHDLAVKRMQSFVTVQPGETAGCVGCHERRTDTGPRGTEPAAMQRAASRIEPVAGAPDVLDFPRDIQPILDARCAPCHGYDKTPDGGPRAGGVILTADRGPMYSHSYYELSVNQQFADGRNRAVSNYAPHAFGSGGSPLMKKADGGHHGVKLSERERTLLRLWIDTGAPYPGTYAALGTGMVGGYAANNLDRSDLAWPSVKAAQAVLAGSCATCHKGRLALPNSPSDDMDMPPWAIDYASPKNRFSRHILYNLSRPEQSILLLAPLAKEAGGWGLCRDPAALAPMGQVQATPGAPGGVLASADAPEYQALLASVRDAAKRLDEIKRFDMAGFQPRPAYLREMKRYGLVPADLAADAQVDFRALERRYWQAFWYKPAE